MPTKKNPKGDMPSTIERSDKHAQAIYTKTLENAEETYKGDEEAAHRVAFAALKHQYKKEGDRCVKKVFKSPSFFFFNDTATTEKKSTDDDRAPTAGGKV